MVDAHGLGPCGVTRGGSSPLFGTKLAQKNPLIKRDLLRSERNPGEEEPSEMMLL